jgi:peptide/nickel transport system permease protein
LSRFGTKLTWVFFLGLHLLALGADLLAPYPYQEQRRERAFEPPTTVHLLDTEGRLHAPFLHSTEGPIPLRFFPPAEPGPRTAGFRLFDVPPPHHLALLGTDGLGRDLLSRLLHGARLSLLAGLLATGLSLALAWPLGTLAGYAGGRMDDLLMRGNELFMALPWLFLLLALRAVLPLETSGRTAFLLTVAVVGVAGWAQPARLIRGVALTTAGRGFVLAARAAGASRWWILRHHILPRTAAIARLQGALLLPRFILAEVTLSFLGLGVPEPLPSLGTLLAQLQDPLVLQSYPWMLWPAIYLGGLTLAYHLVTARLPGRARDITPHPERSSSS